MSFSDLRAFESSWFKSSGARVVLVCALLGEGACKDKSAKPEPVAVDPTPLHAPGSATASTQAPTPKPALPDDVKQVASSEPMSIEDARGALPKLTGTVVLDLKQTSDKRQVHGTWCI